VVLRPQGRTRRKPKPPWLHTERVTGVRATSSLRCCAMVGLGPRGAQRPAMVMEVDLPTRVRARSRRELRELAARHESTQSIKTFYFRAHFPVDVRTTQNPPAHARGVGPRRQRLRERSQR